MIRGSEGYRLFIDVTREGCPCGCIYCFVRHAQETLLDEGEIGRIPGRLLAHPDFTAGPDGTLLAIGTHCDLFRTPTLIQQFLRVLDAVAPLGNPIQVSTKQFIRPEWAAGIAASRFREDQIVVFISCATIDEHRRYEPGTAPPVRRFRSFETLRSVNVPTCFYVKPFLPGVTNRQTDAFIKAVTRAQPSACCVGSLHLNPHVRGRLGPIANRAIDVTTSHPLMEDPVGAVRPPRGFIDRLRAGVPEFPMFETSVCVVAWLHGRRCPIHGSGNCPPAEIELSGPGEGDVSPRSV